MKWHEFNTLFVGGTQPEKNDRSPDNNPPQEYTNISLRFFAAIILALILLFVVTGFLTKAYRAERRGRAIQHFENGQQLAGKGENLRAIMEYRAALSLSHGNSEYQLALALALVKIGRKPEAETYLGELLRDDPTNAVANLAMARIASSEDRITDAEAYYNRAIYGLWPADAEVHRLRARFELVEFLARIGDSKQLLGELVQLRDEVPADAVEMKKRMARLFFTHGDPSNAADIYRTLIRQRHRDETVYAGLGEAELAKGNYLSAQSAFLSTLRLDPQDSNVQERLALVGKILTMDPMQRKLSSTERYSRSLNLLQAAVAKLDECVKSDGKGVPEEVGNLLDVARKSAARKTVPWRRVDAAVEENIQMAEQLWDGGQKLCGFTAPVEDPLALVLARLAQ